MDWLSTWPCDSNTAHLPEISSRILFSPGVERLMKALVGVFPIGAFNIMNAGSVWPEAQAVKVTVKPRQAQAVLIRRTMLALAECVRLRGRCFLPSGVSPLSQLYFALCKNAWPNKNKMSQLSKHTIQSKWKWPIVVLLFASLRVVFIGICNGTKNHCTREWNKIY